MPELHINPADLVTNPTERIPVVVCVDLSPSMNDHNALNELNQATQQFYSELHENPVTQHAVEIAVVGFCGSATTIRDFEPVFTASPPKLEVLGGGTSLGSGVARALELLANRKQQYQQAGVAYNQPWLCIITDGEATDQTHVPLAPQVSALVAAKKLTVFPIWVGACQSINALAMLSPSRPPLRLKNLNFAGLFQFLRESLEAVSASQDGAVVLDTKDLGSWAEI